MQSSVRETEIECLKRIRTSMALLQQNSEGCAANHNGDDAQTFGMPAWLADTRTDLDAFTDILALASPPPVEGPVREAANALASVAAERQRQITKGWTAEHDDLHVDGEIATQAIYVLRGWNVRRPASVVRPIERTWVDPYKHNPRECLVIAAALVVAEIERIDRMTAAEQATIEDWSE